MMMVVMMIMMKMMIMMIMMALFICSFSLLCHPLLQGQTGVPHPQARCASLCLDLLVFLA